VQDGTIMGAGAAHLRSPVAMVRVTVMVPGMAGVMMVTPAVRRVWSVAQTTAASSGCITMRRMTAAMCLTHYRQPRSQTHSGLAVLLWSLNQVKDALEGIIMARDAALLLTHVMRGRVTVTGLVTAA